MTKQYTKLKTNYVGFELENPFLLASAPPTATIEGIDKAFELGWAGAILKTIKPDDLEINDVSPRFAALKDKTNKVMAFENIELVSKQPIEYWIKGIEYLKKKFPTKMVIASIMAPVEEACWKILSLRLQHAGADALELNFSCPHGMPEKGIGMSIGQDRELVTKISKWVSSTVSIPVIVKLSPNVTDIGDMAKAAAEGGADSIAAINTVQSIIGVDLDTLTPLPCIDGYSTLGGLSGPIVKPIGLRCVSQIARSVDLDVSGMGGITTWSDAAEYIALGSSSLQICTSVMVSGFSIIHGLLAGLSHYMDEKGFEQISDFKGFALTKLTSHEKLNHHHKEVPHLRENHACTSCKKCMNICSESGYSAISMEGGLPTIDANKCDGCSLCAHVCDNLVMETPRGNLMKMA
jgi:dihydropyrimidine dehydrogenase (NAD+) subunit PreA